MIFWKGYGLGVLWESVRLARAVLEFVIGRGGGRGRGRRRVSLWRFLLGERGDGFFGGGVVLVLMVVFRLGWRVCESSFAGG